MSAPEDCVTCGEKVYWSKGLWEPTGEQAMVVDTYGWARPLPVVREHVCDPQRIEAYRQARAIEEAQAELARQQYLENLDRAMLLTCAKCGAGPNVRCWNLTERRYGTHVHTVQLHKERIDAAWQS